MIKIIASNGVEIFTHDYWLCKAIAKYSLQKELQRHMREKPERVSYLLNRAKKFV
jgi:hypothetical protein